VAEPESPNVWGWAVGIVGVLASVIALLWKTSRTDKDAQLAAQAGEIKEHQERERAYWKEREAAQEFRIRQTAAMEGLSASFKELVREVAEIKTVVHRDGARP